MEVQENYFHYDCGTIIHKGKLMKKKLLIMLIALFTFGFIFISCGEPHGGSTSNPTVDNKTDPALNGTWVDEIDNGFNFANGNFIFSYNLSSEVIPFVKGKYTNNEKQITLTVTHIYFHNDDKWYSKDAAGAFLKKEGPELSDEDIEDYLNEFFTTGTSGYPIEGNKLTMGYTVYTKMK
jgi:hypothetical protein